MSHPLRPPTAWITLAGLGLLSLWLVLSPPGTGTDIGETRLVLGIACAVPLLALMLSWWRPFAKWGAWVAIVMVPYVTLAVAAALLAVEDRWPAIAFAALTVLVFFTGLDAGRRLGAFRRDV